VQSNGLTLDAHSVNFSPIAKYLKQATMSLPTLQAARVLSRSATRGLAAAPGLKETVLHDRHVELGGKMVPYAGWEMPVLYERPSGGVKPEHLACRSPEQAGLFDVSHMKQTKLRGKDHVGDIAGLAPGCSTLSVITNEKGGIIDDTIITNLTNDVTGMVLNAGCADKDLAHLYGHLDEAKAKGMDVSLEEIGDHELLALQGPGAQAILARYVSNDLVNMAFMSTQAMEIMGHTCVVGRQGYTGSDGFELSIPSAGIRDIFNAFIETAGVTPSGLGARDSTRMEAGLCLYGNDINEETSPVEAGLNWTIGKRRREEGGFLGAEVILDQLKNGITRRRAGFVVTKGAPARGGEPIFDVESGKQVGVVTSGGFGPSVGKAIGQAMINKPHNKSGTAIKFQVRTRFTEAVVSKMPLYPTAYYIVPGQ
jgi:aminomethyltransferase